MIERDAVSVQEAIKPDALNEGIKARRALHDDLGAPFPGLGGFLALTPEIAIRPLSRITL